MLNPAIVRTIGILFRKGKLPNPPEEFLRDPEFEIDLVSQLAQAQRRSELNALTTGLTLVGQMAEFAPDVLDKVSADKAVDETWAIIGAPARVLRSDEEVAKIREVKAQMAQQQQQMDMTIQGADVIKKGSEVDVNMAKAQGEGKK